MLIPRFVRRFLRRLGPYHCLLFLAVPLSIIEPLKLVALFILGDGHFVVGLLIMGCAYAASLFVTEQLFVVVKPKLMTLSWFAEIWIGFVAIRERILRWLRRKWAWRHRVLSRWKYSNSPESAHRRVPVSPTPSQRLDADESSRQRNF